MVKCGSPALTGQLIGAIVQREENSTVQIQPPFCRATVEDICTLSEFIEIASEGLAMHLWSKIAGPVGIHGA